MSSNYGNYPELSPVKRVLVIKLRHLGDVLLSSPVFTQLRKIFPKGVIDAYIWKEAAPMLEGHPGIDHLLTYDRKWKTFFWMRRWGKEISLLWKIWRGKYDLVINLTEGDRGAIAACVSRAKIKVGVDPGKGKKQKIFTHLVKPCPNPRHTVERDLDALRKIGIFPGRNERKLSFHIPPKERKKGEQLFEKEGPYVLIHPGSRWRFKCLPPKLMAKVIDKLEERVVLTGAPSEREFAKEIESHLHSKVMNLVGKTSLKELGGFMLKAKGGIGVDSVFLHMASALKMPIVALFGPTSEENWGPWEHPRARVVAKKMSCRPCRLDGCGGSKMSDCLWTLSPNEIVDAFRQVTQEEEAVAGEETSSSELFVLNSLEINPTE